MITFKKIKIRNFLSFGNNLTTINLDTNQTTLILGNNKDAGEGGYSRNGVGKSSIFQALVWCLYNEGINNIKQDDFINVTNKNKMLVTVEINVNGIDLVIERGRKPAICSITKNGEPYTLSTSDNVDKDIVTLLGMDYALFLNSILLSNNVSGFMSMKGAEQKQFIENLLALHVLSDRAEKLKSLAKETAIDIKMEERLLEDTTNHNLRTIKNIQELTNKSQLWESDISKRKISTEKDLTELRSVDISEYQVLVDRKNELEKEIRDLWFTISELSNKQSLELRTCESEFMKKYSFIEKEEGTLISQVPPPDTFDDKLLNIKEIYKANLAYIEASKDDGNKYIEERKETLSSMNAEINDTETFIKDLKKEADRLKKEHSSLDKGECFYCHQSYTSKEKLDELHSTLKVLNDQLAIIQPEFERNLVIRNMFVSETEEHVKANIIRFKKMRDDMEAAHLIAENDYKRECSVSRDEYNSVVNNIKTTYVGKKQSYKTIYEDDCDSIVAKYIVLKKDYEAKHNSLKKEYDSIECSQEDISLILNNIDHLETMLTEIKDSTNPYLSPIEINSKSIVDVEVNKKKIVELKKIDEHYKILIKLLTDSKSFVRKSLIDKYIPFINQKIKFFLEDMDSPHRIIINNDLTVGIEYMKQSMSYGNLSNGERMRVNFAVCMAIRDFVEMSNSRMNILMIDELLDNGLDADGFYRVFHILDKMNKSTFIISHRDELIPEVDNVMTVIKENGFSRIE